MSAGREAAPLDTSSSRSSHGCSAGGLDGGGDPAAGRRAAAPLHRRERDLQQVLAAVHRLHRREHQSVLQPGACRHPRSRMPVTMKEKILKFRKRAG